jgi:hypothetical protein
MDKDGRENANRGKVGRYKINLSFGIGFGEIV